MTIFPLIPVPEMVMLALNILLWPIFHILVSKFTLALDNKYFLEDRGLFKIHRWEKSGRFYEAFLFIRSWKKFVPDGATIFNEGFKKKSLQGTEVSYLIQFIQETRRAELSHLLQIFPAIFFFIFNTFSIAMIMVVYALAFNLPLIWLQRYNRTRFEKLLSRLLRLLNICRFE
jgi:glycosyl-4,4'-diaponeurosporenoate acyltransferase